LAGKRALVTGGGSGIGLAIAERFVREGAVVEVCDREADRGGRVIAVGAGFTTVDVGDPDRVDQWVAAVTDRVGALDIVVANAGYPLVGDALELSVEDWDLHQNVLLRGVWLTFRAALPAMVTDGGGSLIALGSNLSFTAIPRYTSYLAAKHGVIGLVRGLAVDFADRGIRVNALCPGPTLTGFGDVQLSALTAQEREAALEQGARTTLLGRLGRPEEIAAGAVFLASDEASFVTGSALMVDGGYTAR
jgi:NAD(P)-dependent dehydrogenase (short-subunit alcohol dehydrogenase family)